MNTHTRLATRFAYSTRTLRSETALDEDQMRAVAPSIFAESKHVSRSERYTYIPTIEVLRGMRSEGFEPFMVAQGKSRTPGKEDYTKHLIRLRHVRDSEATARARPEANEIILINSHDGASSCQMLAGVLRFVCLNSMVVGDIAHNIRIPHKGNIQGEVIEGAFRVLEDFETIDASTDAMKLVTLQSAEEQVFARAALELRYADQAAGLPVPITAEQLVAPRRTEDRGASLWHSFQRIQENLLRGGLPGRTVQGRRMRTREVASIDRGVSLNRALWTLAEEMRKLKA